MKFSIVTAAYKAADTIKDTLCSVASQIGVEIEHIVIDGASGDGTDDVVAKYLRPGGIYVSEPDSGIYDAMNKGIARATGDVIGLLNADDLYAAPDVIERVARAFGPGKDAVLGDVAFVRAPDLNKIVRRYNSRMFKPSRIRWGWMPAHPAMFLTRDVYARVGSYRTDYAIAADFEFVARAFGSAKLSYVRLPEVLVTMRLGGASTAGWRSKLQINREVLRACRENGLYSNYLMIASKYPFKLAECLFPDTRSSGI